MKKTRELVSTSQAVPPIPSEDYQIIKTVEEDGTITYRHPVGHLVDTNSLDFDLLCGCMHERYKSLIALLNEDDRQRFGIIFEVITAYNRCQMHEILDFISRCIGGIEVHYVDHAEDVYRIGRVVGISIEPPAVMEARTGKSAQNS